MWHLWQILYLAAWLCLLIHCLRRKRFFPILGSGLSKKLFWLATFPFFNPLLTLLYLLFAVVLPPLAPDRKHPIARTVSILTIAFIAVILIFFELPSFTRHAGPVTIGEKAGHDSDNESGLNLEASAGKLVSNNQYSTSVFSSHSPNARLNVRTILILCQDDHPLLDKTARLLQEQLAALPYVRNVTYYPPSEAVAIEQMLPDVFLMLAMPRLDESRSLAGRKLNAVITVNAGRTLYPGHSHTSYSNSPPVIDFGVQSTLNHESSFTGIESRQARYKQQAENIAKQIGKSLTDQFNKWKDEHGLMPDLPDHLYGVSLAPPELPFLQGDYARRLFSGGGLMLNNHTTWMFTDDRPTLEVLKDCRDQLAQLGWRGGQELDRESKYPIENMTMSRGDEHIQIFRRRRLDADSGRAIFEDADKTAAPMPMIVNYRSLFDADQMETAMNRLLDSDVDLETVMIFEHLIRSEEQKQQLLSRIERCPVQSMRGCLSMAKFYADQKRLEKAKAAFFRARALARTEKQHNPEPNRFKSLAKKLGDESLADANVDLEYYSEAGFTDLTGKTEPVAIERNPNEPAAFCIANDKGEICTVVLTIQPAELPSQNPQTPPQYQLTQITKTTGSSSVGTNPYCPGPTSIYMREYGLDLVNIEPLPNNRFRFTIQPRSPQPQ